MPQRGNRGRIGPQRTRTSADRSTAVEPSLRAANVMRDRVRLHTRTERLGNYVELAAGRTQRARSGSDAAMRRTIVILAGVLASMSICAAVNAAPAALPVTILSCQIGANADERPAMTVEFRNESKQQLTRIIWRARVADGWLDFRDDAGAAPGVAMRRTVSWKVGLLPGYYSSDVNDCSAIAGSVCRRETMGRSCRAGSLCRDTATGRCRTGSRFDRQRDKGSDRDSFVYSVF